VRHILVVDDDGELRKAIARDLEDRGFHVLLAGDGLEAWELLRNGGEAVDAVVTDIRMPNLDGLGLAKRIRALPNPSGHFHLRLPARHPDAAPAVSVQAVRSGVSCSRSLS